MILETKVNIEHHANGQLAYTETIGILHPDNAQLYPNRRIHPEGYEWIRLGKQAKYFDNGQLNWELNYDDIGDVIKVNKPSYRKDGSIMD